MKAEELKPQDLRIGNYVKCVDGNIICIDIGDMMYILSNTFEIKPIPITEEMLLKCGFEKSSGRHGEYYFHGVFKGMRIWVDDITGNYTLGRKSDISTGCKYNTYWIKGGIKHLHQLQNIYWSLCGQELNVNL